MATPVPTPTGMAKLWPSTMKWVTTPENGSKKRLCPLFVKFLSSVNPRWEQKKVYSFCAIQPRGCAHFSPLWSPPSGDNSINVLICRTAQLYGGRQPDLRVKKSTGVTL